MLKKVLITTMCIVCVAALACGCFAANTSGPETTDATTETRVSKNVMAEAPEIANVPESKTEAKAVPKAETVIDSENETKEDMSYCAFTEPANASYLKTENAETAEADEKEEIEESTKEDTKAEKQVEDTKTDNKAAAEKTSKPTATNTKATESKSSSTRKSECPKALMAHMDGVITI